MIETGIVLSVHADPDYHYEVVDGEFLEIRYIEHGRGLVTDLGFGSVDEMEAVAKAMLKVVEFKRNSG